MLLVEAVELGVLGRSSDLGLDAILGLVEPVCVTFNFFNRIEMALTVSFCEVPARFKLESLSARVYLFASSFV